MTRLDDDIFDSVFHGCAFAAYVEVAVASGGVPDEAATRRRAFQLYEEALAERHASRNVTEKS